MSITCDLGPAAAEVTRLADGVATEQLADATPCADWSVAVLLDHLLGLTAAFTAAAAKQTGQSGDADAPPADWRDLLHERLPALVEAWRDPAAWTGQTEAGGVVLPADVMGVVAVDELVLHGWDLAQATRQRFHADPASVQACLGFAASMSEPGQEADREGLYGPVVPTPADASDLDRLLGLTGRDPQWGGRRTRPGLSSTNLEDLA